MTGFLRVGISRCIAFSRSPRCPFASGASFKDAVTDGHLWSLQGHERRWSYLLLPAPQAGRPCRRQPRQFVRPANPPGLLRELSPRLPLRRIPPKPSKPFCFGADFRLHGEQALRAGSDLNRLRLSLKDRPRAIAFHIKSGAILRASAICVSVATTSQEFRSAHRTCSTVTFSTSPMKFAASCQSGGFRSLERRLPRNA